MSTKPNLFPDRVVLWALIGNEGGLYLSKEGAERVARLLWPDEDPDKRYARVYLKEYVREDLT